MNCYHFTKKQTKRESIHICDIYTFKNIYNDVYILEVFHYDFNVYVIKFSFKKDRLSKKRYSASYRIGEKEGYQNGCENAFKLFATIIKVSQLYIRNNELASFGFMGAPKIEELEEGNAENIQNDGTVSNTKRYIVYKKFAMRYFNPLDFSYIDSRTSSILLLRNNKNKHSLSKQKARHYIKDVIIPSLQE